MYEDISDYQIHEIINKCTENFMKLHWCHMTEHHHRRSVTWHSEGRRSVWHSPADPPCWVCCFSVFWRRETRPRSVGVVTSRTRYWWHRRSRCGRRRSCGTHTSCIINTPSEKHKRQWQLHFILWSTADVWPTTSGSTHCRTCSESLRVSSVNTRWRRCSAHEHQSSTPRLSSLWVSLVNWGTGCLVVQFAPRVWSEDVYFRINTTGRNEAEERERGGIMWLLTGCLKRFYGILQFILNDL